MRIRCDVWCAPILHSMLRGVVTWLIAKGDHYTGLTNINFTGAGEDL
jgi:hypothetical protein